MSPIPINGGVRDPGPALIRAWARELWLLGDDDAVVVTQLACSEPGCPPLETVIVIAAAGQPTVRHKLHLPAAEITREHLQSLINANGDRHEHPHR